MLTAGLAWAASWRGFQPTGVVVLGNDRVATARILAVAAIDPHVNIWLQSSGGISARLMRIRSVARVAVHRSLPNRVTLVIDQRIPAARLVADDGSCAVDRRGYLFPLLPRDGGLPAIVAKQLRCTKLRVPPDSPTMRLLSVLARADAAGIRFAALSLDRYGEDRGVLTDGTQIFIGDGTQLDRKFAEVRALELRLHADWRHIKALDLRAPSTPIVVDGKKVEGGGALSVNAMKGRDTRALDRSQVKTSSNRSHEVSKNLRSGGPPRASSPDHFASSP
ncbi:MAG: cell division protein FtsQ/DivIB [Candidatus Baltobacteraceae bacterium]